MPELELAMVLRKVLLEAEIKALLKPAMEPKSAAVRCWAGATHGQNIMGSIVKRIGDRLPVAGLGTAFSAVIVLAIASVAAWVTHLVWIITTLAGDAGATGGQIVLGLLGIFIPPIGMLHGLLIWFGAGM